MVGRWWATSVAAVLAVCGVAAAGELRGVHVAPTPDGASVALELSAPIDVVASDVRGPNGQLARIYIDLPSATGFGGQLRRVNEGAGPVASARVGTDERGRVRVLLDVSSADSYRLRREDGGRTLAVIITTVHGPTGDPAATPPVARAKPPGRLRPKIVLDPGHGGRDPGAQGYAIEKHVTLSISRELAMLLRERLDADVVMTRTGDSTLALGDRTARANSEQADLFVSIHANANPTGRLHGVETYYLDNTDDHATNRLAALENGLDLLHPTKGGADLRYILSDLVQVGKMDESIALATAVQRGLVRRLRARYPSVTDLGVKRGPFYVLVGAYMPCVLVETAFLTHPVEGRRLAGAAYQRAIAEGVYAGITRYLADSARQRTL